MNTQTPMFEGTVEEFAREVMVRLSIPLDKDAEVSGEFFDRFAEVTESGRPTLHAVAETIILELLHIARHLEKRAAKKKAGDRRELDLINGLVTRALADPEALKAVAMPAARIAFGSVIAAAFYEENDDMIIHVVRQGMAPENSLHVAAAIGKASAVKTLLELGFDPRLRDADYGLPEDVARASNHEEASIILENARMRLDRAAQLSHLAEPRSDTI